MPLSLTVIDAPVVAFVTAVSAVPLLVTFAKFRTFVFALPAPESVSSRTWLRSPASRAARRVSRCVKLSLKSPPVEHRSVHERLGYGERDGGGSDEQERYADHGGTTSGGCADFKFDSHGISGSRWGRADPI